MAKKVEANQEKIQLDYPITTGDGKEISELPLRRVKVADMRAAARSGDSAAEQEITLIGRVTGLVPEDVDLLDIVDYQKIQRFLSGNTTA